MNASEIEKIKVMQEENDFSVNELNRKKYLVDPNVIYQPNAFRDAICRLYLGRGLNVAFSKEEDQQKLDDFVDYFNLENHRFGSIKKIHELQKDLLYELVDSQGLLTPFGMMRIVRLYDPTALEKESVEV